MSYLFGFTAEETVRLLTYVCERKAGDTPPWISIKDGVVHNQNGPLDPFCNERIQAFYDERAGIHHCPVINGQEHDFILSELNKLEKKEAPTEAVSVPTLTDRQVCAVLNMEWHVSIETGFCKRFRNKGIPNVFESAITNCGTEAIVVSEPILSEILRQHFAKDLPTRFGMLKKKGQTFAVLNKGAYKGEVWGIHTVTGHNNWAKIVVSGKLDEADYLYNLEHTPEAPYNYGGSDDVYKEAAEYKGLYSLFTDKDMESIKAMASAMNPGMEVDFEAECQKALNSNLKMQQELETVKRERDMHKDRADHNQKLAEQRGKRIGELQAAISRANGCVKEAEKTLKEMDKLANEQWDVIKRVTQSLPIVTPPRDRSEALKRK